MYSQKFLRDGNYRMFVYEQMLRMEELGKLSEKDVRYLAKRLSFIASVVEEYVETEDSSVFKVVMFTRDYVRFMIERKRVLFQLRYRMISHEYTEWGWYLEEWKPGLVDEEEELLEDAQEPDLKLRDVFDSIFHKRSVTE